MARCQIRKVLSNSFSDAGASVEVFVLVRTLTATTQHSYGKGFDAGPH